MIARDFPYLYITWIAPLLSGDRSCEWAVWFKAHWQDFRKAERTFDFAKWNREHTALLQSKIDELRAEYPIWIEDQNKFNWRGQVATLGGKADLVAEMPDQTFTVYDTKSGKPKDSDMIQVQLYMWALPRAVKLYEGATFNGAVVYRDHEIEIPSTTITPTFRGQVKDLITRLADNRPARKVAAHGECKWCEITASDCNERIDIEERTAVTDEF